MNDLMLIGLSHKTAPIELRERCAAAGPLDGLAGLAEETVVLSTCNRFEVYANNAPDADAITDWIARRAQVTREELERHAYVRQGRNASKHLFFVAASLDSLIVGETQIRGQVKDAYEVAQEAGSVGKALHRLFQAALNVSKKIAETTGVGRGNISVAGAAADLAERVFGELSKTPVLVVGAGDTAELIVHHLTSRGVKSFVVVNRTAETAELLAGRYGGRSAGLDALDVELALADVVICAAGGEAPVVTLACVRQALRRRRGRPLVMIDVAMPRGVDPGVDDLDNVYRYDMDALTEVTRDTLRHRRRDFIECCTLIDAATLRLAAAARAQRAGAAIVELERSYEAAAERELADLEQRLTGLDDEGKNQVRRSLRRLVRKLLHLPLQALRTGDPEATETIRRVFSGKDEE